MWHELFPSQFKIFSARAGFHDACTIKTKLKMAEALSTSDSEERNDSLQSGLTDHDILVLSEQVSHKKLRYLGERLGISLTRVENLEHEYQRDTLKVAQKLMHLYRTRESGTVTREKVENILTLINAPDTAKVKIIKAAEDKMITSQLSLQDCKEILVDHYLKTEKIQLTPWNPTNYTDLANLHTNISLFARDRGSRGGTEIKKIPLKGSIHDVFRTKVDGCLPTRILMLGGAGYGKTTMIAKLTHDWATRNINSPLTEVPLLFVLKFRRAKKGVSLGKAICLQLLGHAKGLTPEDIEKFIEENEDDCMVLLDGYDESSENISEIPDESCEDDDSSNETESSLVELLQWKRFKKCRTLVTSRPHREKDFDDPQLSRVYARMEIEGFAESDVNDYINTFFSSHPDQSRDLNKHIQIHRWICSIIYIPFFCMAVCTLWEADLLRNVMTLTKLFNNLLKYIVRHAEAKKTRGVGNMLRTLKQERINSAIYAAGGVALDGLKDNSFKLIFTMKDFDVCSEDLDIAVALGLISKEITLLDSHKWNESPEKTIIEFYHKLAQEHCAGLYLSNLLQRCQRETENILNFLDSGKSAEKHINLLSFAAGSSTQACVEIIQHMNKFNLHNNTMLYDILAEAPDESDLAEVLRPHVESGNICIEITSSKTIHGLNRIPTSIKHSIYNVHVVFKDRPNELPYLWSVLATFNSLDTLMLADVVYEGMPYCELCQHHIPLPSVHNFILKTSLISPISVRSIIALLPAVRTICVLRLKPILDLCEVLHPVMQGLLQTDKQVQNLSVQAINSDAPEEIVSEFCYFLPQMQCLQRIDLNFTLEPGDVLSIVRACRQMQSVTKVRLVASSYLNESLRSSSNGQVMDLQLLKIFLSFEARSSLTMNCDQWCQDFLEEHSNEGLMRVYLSDPDYSIFVKDPFLKNLIKQRTDNRYNEYISRTTKLPIYIMDHI